MLSKLLSPSAVSSAAVVAGLVLATGPQDPAAAGPPGSAPTGATQKDHAKVRARAFLATDKLPAGRTTAVAVVLDIADGWHVRGAEPAEKYAVPTVVSVKTKRGTQIGRFAFPTDPPLAPGGERRPVQELHGRVVLRAAVKVPAAAAGGDEELEVTVRYQACDDTQCLRPKTLTFGGTLPVAAAGEPVAPANAQWFPQPTEGRPAARTAARP